MGLNISTITASIAGLDVAGVTIKDKDGLKEGWSAYECPLFSPRPNDFVGFPQVVSASLGSGTGHQMDVSYNLIYRYFHAPIGQGDVYKIWSDMTDKIFNILYTLATNDAITGSIDLQVTNISQFGVVEDGAGNQFHGCDVTMRILEHIN